MLPSVRGDFLEVNKYVFIYIDNGLKKPNFIVSDLSIWE